MLLMRYVLVAPVTTATIAHRLIQLTVRRYTLIHSTVPRIGIGVAHNLNQNRHIYRIGNIAVRGVDKDAKENNAHKNHPDTP